MLKILPTDTCYGIAWNLEKSDFEAIYRLKGRDASKKLAFLVRDFDELWKIAIITEEQIKILQNYPHPFSVLLPLNKNYNFPEFLKMDNYQLIFVRIWEKILQKNILEKLEFPLFLTSANKSGEKESTTFLEAKQIFPEIDGFDGGICNHSPSNIFEFWENNELKFLRENYKNFSKNIAVFYIFLGIFSNIFGFIMAKNWIGFTDVYSGFLTIIVFFIFSTLIFIIGFLIITKIFRKEFYKIPKMKWFKNEQL